MVALWFEAVARKGNDHYLYALAKDEEGYKLPKVLRLYMSSSSS